MQLFLSVKKVFTKILKNTKTKQCTISRGNFLWERTRYSLLPHQGIKGILQDLTLWSEMHLSEDTTGESTVLQSCGALTNLALFSLLPTVTLELNMCGKSPGNLLLVLECEPPPTKH